MKQNTQYLPLLFFSYFFISHAPLLPLSFPLSHLTRFFSRMHAAGKFVLKSLDSTYNPIYNKKSYLELKAAST